MQDWRIFQGKNIMVKGNVGFCVAANNEQTHKPAFVTIRVEVRKGCFTNKTYTSKEVNYDEITIL